MKLNKSHPQWLGDYDVFAVDINNKSIWIVECKVIEKVATLQQRLNIRTELDLIHVLHPHYCDGEIQYQQLA